MRRSALPLAALTLFVLLSGCATNPHGVILRPDGGRYPSDRYYRRVDDDAHRYTRSIDRRLRLNNRQIHLINRMLSERAYTLLDRTSPSRHRQVYPFPRQYRQDRNRIVRRWWAGADRDIERVLSRQQAREYRYLVRGEGRYGRRDGYYGQDRGPYDRRTPRYGRRGTGRDLRDEPRSDRRRGDDD